MTLAIMQPYFLPYIGYFQLVKAADKFVAYDDVNFIKQGWINRNNILLNGEPFLFTIPLENASSFSTINSTRLNPKFYPVWREKFVRTVAQNYKKAPHFGEVIGLLDNILKTECETISELAFNSIRSVADYLGLSTTFEPTSARYQNAELKGQERILDICKKEQADHYINPIGGQELYSKAAFEAAGIKLNFIKQKPVVYEQFNKDKFVPWLSILDVLMFNGISGTRALLDEYELI